MISKPKQMHQHPPPVKGQCCPFSWHGTQGRSAGPWARRKLPPVGSHVPGTVVVKLVKTNKSCLSLSEQTFPMVVLAVSSRTDLDDVVDDDVTSFSALDDVTSSTTT